MTEGDIVLTSLAQADGRVKIHPALILRILPPFNDVLLCGLITQLNQEVIAFDERIERDDPDFQDSGLMRLSLIRLGFLSSLPQQNILGIIDAVSASRHQRLLRRLSAFLVEHL